MLKVYSVARMAARDVAVVVARVERRDGDLAKQLRRAMQSVVQNMREGSMSQGRNRNARYWNAMGSANEVIGCLDIAEDFGYFRANDETRARLGQVIATLRNVVSS